MGRLILNEFLNSDSVASLLLQAAHFKAERSLRSLQKWSSRRREPQIRSGQFFMILKVSIFCASLGIVIIKEYWMHHVVLSMTKHINKFDINTSHHILHVTILFDVDMLPNHKAFSPLKPTDTLEKIINNYIHVWGLLRIQPPMWLWVIFLWSLLPGWRLGAYWSRSTSLSPDGKNCWCLPALAGNFLEGRMKNDESWCGVFCFLRFFKGVFAVCFDLFQSVLCPGLFLCFFFPESIWAKGSSKRRRDLHIKDIFSHLLASDIFLHLLTSDIFSHLTSSHISHLLTSSHIWHLLTSHIFSHLTSSHIFTSDIFSHLTSSRIWHLLTSHIFSHLLTTHVFLHPTSSHIFSHLTSSHIWHLLTSDIFSHLTSSHIFSHLTSSHIPHLLTSHIFSHLHIWHLLTSDIFSHLTSSHISHLLTSSYNSCLLTSHIFSHLLTSDIFSHLTSSHISHLLTSSHLSSLFFLLKAGGRPGGPSRTSTLCGDRACPMRET